ncbi:bifunctional tetrahydrofolate synthase/dihydrofolate synthase [Marinobacter sp. X15-166B]|uniref:bifunctional tetrahydrofolate synthase/dihydrofolate synthase n=1 Tax=Marinobacter sp. X15-166B TaxID=1897620 RepID=UPI00085C0A73|nr:bifunctional tetrahydrofolate synthase/dihydrofolate synthase [Marinobacter sp. X15-166B]OEY67705.1 bifunctional folylpolyglutamate synthase/dihydrofolate synthase [Marinobacter sp. X15-166B]
MPTLPKNNASAARPLAPGADATLAQWLGYLESIHPAEIDMGLERVLTVYRRLFRRRPEARVITVAGTNGKGSTVGALEQLLSQAGRSVGTYTSPHLERYNERVRIDGAEVSDRSLVAAFNAIEQARGETTLTYFEFGTLAALVLMAEAGVDDWILEVGLGGRLDAVNIVDADLAIITSIDIDHVSYLGDDREVIGFEKAGILRRGKPAVYADLEPPASVLQQASAQSIPLLRPGKGYELTPTGRGGLAIACPSLGRAVTLPQCHLPEKSMAAAVIAAVLLEPELSDDAVVAAIGRVRLPGRFEKLRADPALYVDVGHNPHAAGWLAGKLTQVRGRGQIRAVYACLEDKDTAGVVRALSGVVDHWHLAGLAVSRGLGVAELAERVKPELADAGSSVQCHSCVSEALGEAIAKAAPDDLIIAFGSFFTVEDARRWVRHPVET